MPINSCGSLPAVGPRVGGVAGGGPTNIEHLLKKATNINTVPLMGCESRGQSTVVPLASWLGHRTLTGANESSHVAVTHEEAMKDLGVRACNFIFDGGLILSAEKSCHEKRLEEHAISLFVLAQGAGLSDNPEYKNACALLSGAGEAYLSKGEKGYSSTCSVKNTAGYELDKRIERAIDKLVIKNPEVFGATHQVMYDMYLKSGLPKVKEARVGLILDSQSSRESSHKGNASAAAEAALYSKLDGFVAKCTGSSLVDFISALLGQLDLGADVNEPVVRDDRVKESVRSDDNRVKPETTNTQVVNGANNHITIDLGPVIDELRRLNLSQNFGERAEANVAPKGAEGASVSTESRCFDESLKATAILGAFQPEVPPPPELSQRSGVRLRREEVASALTEPQSFDKALKATVGHKAFQSEAPPLPGLTQRLDESGKGGDGPSASTERKFNRDSNVTSVNKEKGAQGEASPSWRRGASFDLDLKRMPKKAPADYWAYQGPTGRERSEEFYRQISFGIQGVGVEARVLKAYIAEGRDPSQAKAGASGGEADIHRLYAKAKKESPEFATRLEKLFEDYRSISMPKPLTLHAPVVTSYGGATAVLGNPKKEPDRASFSGRD